MHERSKSAGPDPLLGQTVDGRYRIVRRLGQGGMGAVYEAEHIGLDKRVAVKFLLEKYTEDEEALERFRREARTASRIGHDHIVDITDIGQTEAGRSFIVMEFLAGRDLAELLRQEGPLAPERAVALVSQILDGLAAAHELGIVHRDMKPENVFVLRKHEREFVKIMDFGISKIIDAHDSKVRLTETGMVLGTPLYMAPEQAQAVPDISFRADIYAVGCMLFEMLTGRPPFQGTHYLGLVTQHLYEPPPPLRSVQPHAPPALEAVILRALAKDPQQRWDGARELAAAARAALGEGAAMPLPMPAVPASGLATDGRPASVPAPTPAPTQARPRGRTPLLLVGGAVVLAAGMVGLAFLTSGAPAPAAGAEAAPETAATPAALGAENPAESPPLIQPMVASLSISSTPRGARVLVDGVERGRTPLDVTDLVPGTYELRLELEGFQVLTTSKELRVGDNELMVALAPAAAPAELGDKPPRTRRPRLGSRPSAVLPQAPAATSADAPRRSQAEASGQGPAHDAARTVKPTNEVKPARSDSVDRKSNPYVQ